jgi:adenylate cyclase class IV
LVLIDDEDILVNSRRIVLKIETSLTDDEELSEYIQLRLFLAREMAISKYREIYHTA